MVAAGQGQWHQKSKHSFLSDSKNIITSAKKRQVRGICPDSVLPSGSPDLSASVSAGCVFTNQVRLSLSPECCTGGCFKASIVNVSHFWMEEWRKHWIIRHYHLRYLLG